MRVGKLVVGNLTGEKLVSRIINVGEFTRLINKPFVMKTNKTL